MFKDVKVAAIFLLNRAVLLGITMLALLVPAHCQQEVDPSWYDPSIPASKAVVQQSQQERMAAPREQPAKTATSKNKRQARVQATRERRRPKQLAAINR